MLVSIVLPTRNEEENIAVLLSKFNFASNNISYEAVVVDDSTDKTAEVAKKCGARVIKGKGQGLGQAIIDGIMASKGEIVLVMDADGQHSPEAIPGLLKPIFEEGADMVIGSRFAKGGDTSEFGAFRTFISKFASWVGKASVGISDATTGFFAFRKSILEK